MYKYANAASDLKARQDWEAAQEGERLEKERRELCDQLLNEVERCILVGSQQFDKRDLLELKASFAAGCSFEELKSKLESLKKTITGPWIGYNALDRWNSEIRIPEELRRHHLYIVGKSGYGKTNLLRWMLVQDMLDGHGIGVLAPEYEMIQEEILPFVPGNRINDVIYFNPLDFEAPVVLNPLHLEPGDDLDRQVDEVFTIFSRLIGEGGPRMNDILRFAITALVERPGSILTDMFDLLDRENSSLRDEVVRTTQDARVQRYFGNIYEQLPKDAHLPIYNRLGHIIHSKYARNCLCPVRAKDGSVGTSKTLSIRKAMDSGKILLFNLSDGMLGASTSQLIGQLIVSKFQTATMSRADIPEQERRPFYLYLDEFQNFVSTAAESYSQILSRARKYRLGITLAHQQTAQIPDSLLKDIIGNVSSIMCFQVSHLDAAKLSHAIGKGPYTDFYTDLEKKMTSLPIGAMYANIGNKTFSVNVPKFDLPPKHERARKVIARSRATYGNGSAADLKPIDMSGEEGSQEPLDNIDPGDVFA